MQTFRLAALVAAFSLLAILAASRPGASPPDSVELHVLRYPDLGQRIKDLRGRVVVVDFWADYCLPCKREFPKLVALHRKYAATGLAAVSVSLDDAADAEAVERVKRFLAAQRADFPHCMLNERPEVWQAKLKIDGPPCVFVFNGRGELVKKYHDDVDYAEVERIVADLLKQDSP